MNLKLNMKKRIKDSFLIGYGVIFPFMMIAILGYMSSNYYDNSLGVSFYYYYTMGIILFCIFLGSVTLIYYAREESLYKCGERYIIAPISKSMVVLLKILPSTSISMLIAVLSKSELQGNLIASCFGVITIIIGGTFMSIEKMPKGLKFISNISISKWIAELVKTVDGNIITREKSSIIIFLIIFSILIVILSLKIGEKKLAKN